MMNSVDGAVLQERSQGSCSPLATKIGEFDNPHDVLVRQLGQEIADISLDCAPGLNERVDGRIVIRSQRRTTLGTAAPVKPTPFGAQNMNQRVPHGAITSSDRPRKLF